MVTYPLRDFPLVMCEPRQHYYSFLELFLKELLKLRSFRKNWIKLFNQEESLLPNKTV